MRGSPVIRAVLAFLALLALAPLLARVTTQSAQKATAAPVPAEPKKVLLSLTFTSPPTRVAIVHLGHEVWTKASPSIEEEISLDVPWPEQGAELVFRVDWPEGVPIAAMRARLTDPKDVEIERSLWGAGPSESVLNFP